MIQGGDGPGLAVKPLDGVTICLQLRRQQFHGHVALELSIAREIDLTHPACADGGDNLVRAEPGTGGQAHPQTSRAFIEGPV